MKTSKKLIIAAILVTLLPCLIGILLWNRLPAMIPSHFDFHNNVDGWMRKELAVFGLPAFMAALEIYLIFMSNTDPKKQNIGKKLFSLIIWVIPFMSLFMNLACYAIALGINIDMGLTTNLLLGILFIGVGNYMPKSKQSYTMGIKLPWTLSSEENWNRTHRLAGWLWMGSGFLFILNGFFKTSWLLFITLFLMAVVPSVYSYLLYKNGI